MLGEVLVKLEDDGMIKSMTKEYRKLKTSNTICQVLLAASIAMIFSMRKKIGQLEDKIAGDESVG